ncbi:hypothetical protein K504DRAFT_453851 [Pleomassaria siparia CBS 279.74]|uniref:Uncharacterized protein n=1 Tax=Pleomassaria siparia CBS 279.74 TaxID=1314801 RepID=A0A6G1KEL4_9PLEO|nr:hypothetical protein K504DRAFT_453851 [Pleomassaria siparia CBS 279.74]
MSTISLTTPTHISLRTVSLRISNYYKSAISNYYKSAISHYCKSAISNYLSLSTISLSTISLTTISPLYKSIYYKSVYLSLLIVISVYVLIHITNAFIVSNTKFIVTYALNL